MFLSEWKFGNKSIRDGVSRWGDRVQSAKECGAGCLFFVLGQWACVRACKCGGMIRNV